MINLENENKVNRLKLQNLINVLKPEKRVFIQAHNFPDHDAIASAYGLQYLLNEFGIKSEIIYKGNIQRESLKKMIEKLKIEANSYEKFNITNKDKIIIIDACKGNSNLFDLKGYQFAVIDHHNVETDEQMFYQDIRPSYGACSTIIYSYFKSLNIEINEALATALLIGIDIDTALLTRGVSEYDIEAFSNIYHLSDITFVNFVVRNHISKQDLIYYKYLLENVTIDGNFGFCYFENGCSQNLLGILADYLLSVQEINFVVLCSKNGEVVNLSIRNELKQLDASKIIQEVLEGIGLGGGHTMLAGGVISKASDFKLDYIYNQFKNRLKHIKN